MTFLHIYRCAVISSITKESCVVLSSASFSLIGGHVNFVEQEAETLDEFFDVTPHVVTLYDSLHVRDYLLRELNVVIPDEARLVLHAIREASNEEGIFEKAPCTVENMPFVNFCAVVEKEGLIFEKNHVEQIQKDNLLSRVFVVQGRSECLNDRSDDEVNYFGGQILVRLYWPYYELHEFAGRRIYSLSFLIEFLAHRLDKLSSHVLQSCIHDCLYVLVAAFKGQNLNITRLYVSQIFGQNEFFLLQTRTLHGTVHLVELWTHVRRNIRRDNVLDELVLGG